MSKQMSFIFEEGDEGLSAPIVTLEHMPRELITWIAPTGPVQRADDVIERILGIGAQLANFYYDKEARAHSEQELIKVLRGLIYGLEYIEARSEIVRRDLANSERGTSGG